MVHWWVLVHCALFISVDTSFILQGYQLYQGLMLCNNLKLGRSKALDRRPQGAVISGTRQP
jgi:hypothetical protein